MSIVFTVQSEERVLCTSKPLIWEAVQWGWVGVGERGQEIRIRVINNFCSVINQRYLSLRNTLLSPCRPCSFFPLLLFSFILSVHFNLRLDSFLCAAAVTSHGYLHGGRFCIINNLCILCESRFNCTVNLQEFILSEMILLNLYY